MVGEHNLAKRRIYMFGEVCDSMAKRFVQYAHYWLDQNTDPIYVYINSEGGSIISAFTIVDTFNLLRSKGIQVYTINLGESHSAASFILAHGSKGCRSACSLAVTMLHPSSYALGEDYSENHANTTAFLAEFTTTFNKMLAKACGKPYNKFLKDIGRGLWLKADKAIEYGVIDKIE